MFTSTRIVASLGNIAARSQILAGGVSGFQLTAAVRAGELRRVRRGHYATPAADSDAVAAVRVGGRLCGVSAARSYGLWGGMDTRLHIAVRANAGRLRTNYAPSFARELTPDTSTREIRLHWLVDRELAEPSWRVSAPLCLAEVVSWEDEETAVACLDTARTILGLSSTRIAELFATAPALDRLRASRSVPGSDSGLESVVRQRLLGCGIHIRQQITIPGVGRVDMGVVGTRVVIEIDGREHHGTPSAFEEDRRRLAELVARGYTVLRFSYSQIMFEWPWCLQMIRSAIS